MPLSYSSGYLFVDLPEGRFLVDTGSPFTFGAAGRVTYGSVSRDVPNSIPGVSLAGLEAMGVVCDGLLGMDIMAHVTTLWDLATNTAFLGLEANPDAEASVRVELSLPLSVPGASPFPYMCSDGQRRA